MKHAQLFSAAALGLTVLASTAAAQSSPGTGPTPPYVPRVSGATSGSPGQQEGATALCTPAVRDVATGDCVTTSSVPMLGSLYPLGPDFFIDGTSGNVGIGTTSPTRELTVEGGAQFLVGTSLGTPTPGRVDFGTPGGNPGMVLYSNEDVRYDLFASEFRMHAQRNGGDLQWLLGASDLFVSNLAGNNDDPVAIFRKQNCGNSCAQPAWTEGMRVMNTNQNGRIGIGFVVGDEAVSAKPDVFIGTGDNAWGQNDFRIATYSAGDLRDRFEIDGDSGLVTVRETLEIRGGADIVERFESSCGELEPGTVVVIDPDHAGALTCSWEAYDRKVAGVVSGAGGVQPGLCLGQDGVMDGDTSVAMTGRVYVKCSAENGAITPGDRLTTAALPGHAMKATDGDRSDGAVIGKAMSALDDGTGLVLVLVNLQ